MTPNSYGLLYQWGRKDPYRNMAAGSINERPEINPAWKTVTGNTVYWNDWNIQNAWSSWEKRNNYPLCFMYSRTYYDGRDYNWVKYETAPTHYLWFTPKTNFDPCPAGYRLPTQQEFDVGLYTRRRPGTSALRWSPTGNSIRCPRRAI